MHIPDGYISPATAGIMYGAAAPFWFIAAKKVRKSLSGRTIPVVALFASFSFVLMMFNIPMPGGTTGHAVGGTLLAIAAGPWAAVIGISVVLAIQALFFGDGGVMAFGANSFNMAIILPLVGYYVYRTVSGSSSPQSARRLFAAAAGSWIAIVTAALLTGIELGIQPLLFHSADGTPLYCPYGPGIAIPSMAVGHMFIAGPAEAIVTGLVLAYLFKTGFVPAADQEQSGGTGRLHLLWAGLGLVALLTPIGLLASGTAWGEWGVTELQELGLGFVPDGINRLAGWWPAPLPDYGFPRMGAVVGYILSTIAGVGAVAAMLWALGKTLLAKGRRSEA